MKSKTAYLQFINVIILMEMQISASTLEAMWQNIVKLTACTHYDPEIFFWVSVCGKWAVLGEMDKESTVNAHNGNIPQSAGNRPYQMLTPKD